MKIAILTCDEHPDLPKSDQMVKAVFEKKGHQVSALNWESDFEASDFDAVWVKATWDYPLKYEKFLRKLHEWNEKTFLFNSLETILWNSTKKYLVELGEIVPTVPTLYVPKNCEIPVLDSACEKLILKPLVSVTSYLTFVIPKNDKVAIQETAEKIWQHSDLMIQPFLEEICELGEVSMMYVGGKNPGYSHSVLKVPKKGDFRVQNEWGGSIDPYLPTTEMLEIGNKAVTKVPGTWLWGRVDLIFQNKKPLLSELEVVEPEIYINEGPEMAEKLLNEFESIYSSRTPHPEKLHWEATSRSTELPTP